MTALFLAISAASADAVVTSISQQGTDVVLNWSSVPGQQFTVQFRESLDPGSGWLTLTNGLSAAENTNQTTFVHAGVLPGGGEQMQAQSGGETQPRQLSEEQKEALRAERKAEAEKAIAWLMAQLEAAIAEANAWREAVAKNPALLEAARQQAASAPAALESSSAGCCGFYRVLHTPTWTVDPTGYTFDGPIFIPVDFADYLEEVNDVIVLLNGQPAPQAVLIPFVQQGVTNWGVGIYFDLVTNGMYQIQLQSTVRLAEETGEGTASVVLTNKPTSIIVDNEVTFGGWDELIYGSTYTFRAQTKNLNTDWTIEIYDAWGQYINGASGHTSNGQIEWTWDFRDIFGNLRDDLDNDPFWDPYITFDTSGAGAVAAAQATRRTPAPTPYPNQGAWIIANQDRFYLDAGPNYAGGDAYYQDGINNLIGGPALWNVPVSHRALNFGTNVYTQAQRNASWADLRATMFDPRYRNFYYYGHGAATDIGADVHTFDATNDVTGGRIFSGSNAHLSSGTVRSEITFNRFAGARPYRFAFLDGCNTANGDWPDAFGIEKSTNTLSFYTGAGNTRRVRPSAFVGWTVTVGGKGWGTADKFWEFRGFWMGNWSVDFLNFTLTEALQSARQGSNWIPLSKMNESMKVFGYGGLRFNEYNYENSWP